MIKKLKDSVQLQQRWKEYTEKLYDKNGKLSYTVFRKKTHLSFRL